MLGATRKKLTCLPGFNLEPCESLIGKVKFSDHERNFGRSILEYGFREYAGKGDLLPWLVMAKL